MRIVKYSENGEEDILKLNDTFIAVIDFNGDNAYIGLLDECVEHNILLNKLNINSLDIDKYFRIIFDRETADWTFICPSNYNNIKDKVKRIGEFYKDGFREIANFLSQIEFYSNINIPKRYRRHYVL